VPLPRVPPGHDITFYCLCLAPLMLIQAVFGARIHGHLTHLFQQFPPLFHNLTPYSINTSRIHEPCDSQKAQDRTSGASLTCTRCHPPSTPRLCLFCLNLCPPGTRSGPGRGTVAKRKSTIVPKALHRIYPTPTLLKSFSQTSAVPFKPLNKAVYITHHLRT